MLSSLLATCTVLLGFWETYDYLLLLLRLKVYGLFTFKLGADLSRSLLVEKLGDLVVLFCKFIGWYWNWLDILKLFFVMLINIFADKIIRFLKMWIGY